MGPSHRYCPSTRPLIVALALLILGPTARGGPPQDEKQLYEPLSVSSRPWRSGDTDDIRTQATAPVWRNVAERSRRRTLPSYDSELRTALRANDQGRIALLLRLGREQYDADATGSTSPTPEASGEAAARKNPTAASMPPSAATARENDAAGNDTDHDQTGGAEPDPETEMTGAGATEASEPLIPTSAPSPRPALPRRGLLRNEKCCKCSGGSNPDLRWPGVGGSPAVNEMGRKEYVWGPQAQPEGRNPVGRMNQPRPDCCPCSGSSSGSKRGSDGAAPSSALRAVAGGSEARFVTVSTPGGALRAALDGRSPWAEILAAVLAQRDVQRLLVRGDALDAQAALRSEAALHGGVADAGRRESSGSASDAEVLAAYHKQLDKTILVAHVREMLAQRAIERFDREASVAAPAFEKIIAAHADTRLSTPGATEAAARALCARVGPELCSADASGAGNISAGTGPAAALSEALPLEITTAYRLLSRGPASSVCVAVGAARCLRTMQEAMTAGDAPTASALRSLLVHAAEASEAVGRLQLAKGQAELARRRFAEAVEQGQPASVIRELEASLRDADRAANSEAEWHQMLRTTVGLPTTFSPDSVGGEQATSTAAVLDAVQMCSAANPTAGSPISDLASQSEEAAAAARRRVLCIALLAPAPLRHRIVSACAIKATDDGSPAPPLFPRGFDPTVAKIVAATGNGDASAAALAFPITADCLCTAVGPVRCMEGAFRAYVHGDVDVLLALAMLRGGNVTGPARAFCDALGSQRCNLVVQPGSSGDSKGGSADDSAHEAVGVLWRVLRERPIPLFSSPLFSSKVGVKAGSGSELDRLQLDNAAQNVSDESAADYAAFKALDAILAAVRVAHFMNASHGEQPPTASSALRAAVTSVSPGNSSTVVGLGDGRIAAILAGWANVSMRELLGDTGVVLLPFHPSGNDTFVIGYSLIGASRGVREEARGDWRPVDLARCASDVDEHCKLLERQRHPVLSHSGLGVYTLSSDHDSAGMTVAAFDRDSIYAYLVSAANVASRARLPAPLAPPATKAGLPTANPDVPRRLGICIPTREFFTRASCLDREGTCSLLRDGRRARSLTHSSRADDQIEGAAELPRKPSDLTADEQQMAVGGDASMQARQARARAASQGLSTTPAERAAAAAAPGGVSVDEGAAYDAAVASGAVDGGADPTEVALALARSHAGIASLLGKGEPGVGAVGVADDTLIAQNRAECETFRGPSGELGAWTSSNRWIPFLHPTALGAVVRALDVTALSALLRFGLADVNGAAPTERLEATTPVELGLDAVGIIVRGFPCNSSAGDCTSSAARPNDGDDRLYDLRAGASSLFILDTAPSGGRALLVDRTVGVVNRSLIDSVSFNGSSLNHALPASARNGACALPQAVGAAATWATEGCTALAARPWDVLVAATTGAIPAEGACVLSFEGCTIPANHSGGEYSWGIAPPAHAATASLRAMSALLAHRGAIPAFPTRALALRWYVVHDADSISDEDLTVGDGNTNAGHGRMGYVTEADGRWPWWECVPRVEDGGGCGDADEDDEDDGSVCDPQTGEGCECDSPEPEDSDLECSPTTHRKRPRTVSDTKITRKLTKKRWDRGSKNKQKSKSGKAGKPKKCDPNPFTNLLFFIFCIIMLILEAIMKAIFGFIELAPPPALLQLSSARSFLADSGSQLAYVSDFDVKPRSYCASSICALETCAARVESVFLGENASFADTVALYESLASPWSAVVDVFTLPSVSIVLRSGAETSHESPAAGAVLAEVDSVAERKSSSRSYPQIHKHGSAMDILLSTPLALSHDAGARFLSSETVASGEPQNAAPYATAASSDKPCSCFCPSADGVQPIPALAGHAMVTVDAGTTALLIGGYCADDRPGADAAVYTSKAWYLRIGRGPSPAAVMALADRVLRLQEAAAAASGRPAFRTPRSANSTYPPPTDHANAFLQQQQSIASDTSTRSKAAFRRRRTRVLPSVRDDVRFLTTPGMSAVPGDGRGASGVAWFAVGVAPPGIRRLGEPAGQSRMARGVGQWFPSAGSPRWRLEGRPMRPRAGHSVVSLGRYVGDGGSEEEWRRLFAGKPPASARGPGDSKEAAQFSEEFEILWPAAFPADPTDASLSEGASPSATPAPDPAALHRVAGERLLLRAVRGTKFEYLDNGAVPAGGAGGGEWIPAVSPLPAPEAFSAGQDDPRAILERPAYIGYQVNATASLFDAIVIFGGSDGGIYRSGRCSDQRRGPRAAGCGFFDDVWVLLRFSSPSHAACAEPGSDGWTCWLPPADKQPVPGRPSETLQGFGVSPSYAQALAVAGVADAPVTVGFRLVGGASTPPANVGATRTGSSASGGSADRGFLPTASLNLDAAFDIDHVDAGRLATHLRDPLHYAWTWRWWPASRAGAVANQGRFSPSPRDGHSASVVAGELMVVVGGRGPYAAAPSQTLFFADVHVLHVPTLTWLPVFMLTEDLGRRVASGTGPAGRAAHSATAVGPAIYVFGGHSAGTVHGDVWVLHTNCGVSVAPEEAFAPLPSSPTARDYAVPLPVRRVAPACQVVRGGGTHLAPGSTVVRETFTLGGTKAVRAFAESGGGLAFAWRELHPLGASSGPRTGHTALLLGHRLTLVAGYGGSGSVGGDGAWRLGRGQAGLRSDVVSLALPLPRVEAFEPLWLPPAGGVRVTIRGRAFGSCGNWRAVNGVPLCAATCDERGNEAETWPPRCDPRDLTSWVDNNAAAVARIDVGGAHCTRIAWHSPRSLSCELGPGVGRFACGGATVAMQPWGGAAACGVVVTLADGLTSSADTGPPPDGPSPPPPLFHILPPEVFAVTPVSLVDHPPRGPLVILGRHFGSRESHVLGSGAAHAVFGGGELREDGSVAFSHTRETLRSAMYSRAGGSDGRSAPGGPWLGIVVWVGRRPCLRAVWHSDETLVCECVGRSRRPTLGDATTPSPSPQPLPSLYPRVARQWPAGQPAVELLARTVETTLGAVSLSAAAVQEAWEGGEGGAPTLVPEDDVEVLGHHGADPSSTRRMPGAAPPRPWTPGAVVVYVHGRRSPPVPFRLLPKPAPPPKADRSVTAPACPTGDALAPLHALLRSAPPPLPPRESAAWHSLLRRVAIAIDPPERNVSSNSSSGGRGGDASDVLPTQSSLPSPQPGEEAEEEEAEEEANDKRSAATQRVTGAAMLVELVRGGDKGSDAPAASPPPPGPPDEGGGDPTVLGDPLSGFCVVRIVAVEDRFQSLARLLQAARDAVGSGGGSEAARGVRLAFQRGIAWIGVLPMASEEPPRAAAERVASAVAERLLAPRPVAGADGGVAQDLLSGGCGCAGLVTSARDAVGPLQLSGVEPRCRRSLREYAWALGCADLAAEWAAACSSHAPERAGGRRESAPRGPCPNLLSLVKSRCGATAAGPHLPALLELATSLLGGGSRDSSGARFRADPGGDTDGDNSTAAAPPVPGAPQPQPSPARTGARTVPLPPPSPDVVGFLTPAGAGGIGFSCSSAPSAAASTAPPCVLSAFAPEWEEAGGGGAASKRRGGAVCPLGAPPTPRQLAAGVVLGDGRTAVLHGGRSEAQAPGDGRVRLRGPPGRALAPKTLSGTYLLAAVPGPEWAALGLPVGGDGLPGPRCREGPAAGGS